MRIATRAIVHTDEGILLLKRRIGLFINHWDLPGGTLEDYDRSLEDCIIRETLEESGLHIQPREYTIAYSEAYKVHYFEAVTVSGEFRVNEEEFFLTPKNFFRCYEIRDMSLAFDDNKEILLNYCR